MLLSRAGITGPASASTTWQKQTLEITTGQRGGKRKVDRTELPAFKNMSFPNYNCTQMDLWSMHNIFIHSHGIKYCLWPLYFTLFFFCFPAFSFWWISSKKGKNEGQVFSCCSISFCLVHDIFTAVSIPAGSFPLCFPSARLCSMTTRKLAAGQGGCTCVCSCNLSHLSWF